MNKTDVIKAMAEAADITVAAATEALHAFQDCVTQTLRDDDKLTLVDFGTFSVSLRAARKGRNPRTGLEIDIPESKVVKFKAGKKLKDEVN